MKRSRTLLGATVTLALVLLGGALVSSSRTADAAPIYRWGQYDAEAHLRIGRFAARNAIRRAECLGVAGRKVDKYGVERFSRWECQVEDDNFETDDERQLVLNVTGPTTFRVTWLKQLKVCPE